MSEFTVACSPLSGTIYAGKPVKDGMWGKVKHDVTDAATSAVAMHLHQKKCAYEFDIKGKTYTLSFNEVKDENI